MSKVKVMGIIIHMGAGGAQELMVNYLRAFKNDDVIDFRLVVVEEPRGSKYDRIIRNENLQAVYLNAPTSLKSYGRIRKKIIRLQESRLIYGAIKEFEPDIIHTHLTQIFGCALFPVMLSGVKLRFHTLHSDPQVYKGMDYIMAKLAFSIGRFMPVCINEKQQIKARKKYGFKENELIFNGIPFDDIKKSMISKDRARADLSIPQNAFVVGTVGRINKVKNFSFLIDVFNELKKDNDNAILVIVGSGDHSQLSEKISEMGLDDSVKFMGEMDNVVPAYCAFDVFVLTSFHESCSLVTLEAQAAGVRCVVSEGIPEESVFTDKVIRLSVDEPLNVWSRCVQGLETDLQGNSLKNASDYDIQSSVKKMKNIYLSYCNKIEHQREVREC